LDLRYPNIWLPLVFCSLTAMLFLWWAKHGSGRFTRVAAVVFTLSDLAVFASCFHPVGGPEKYAEPAVVSHLKSDHGLFRTITFCSHIDAEASWNWLLAGC
jgi:hypothetical protein